MVIVQLVGGLGNQMFQYATGRAIAHRNSVPLKLDISEFQRYPERDYRLGFYNIVEEFVTTKDLTRLTPTRAQFVRWLIEKLKRRLLPYYTWSVIKERSLAFDPNVLKIGGNVYLIGYWQSERYFTDVARLIRNEFTLRGDPDEINRQTLEHLASVNSVSLHIRRGDYVTDPAAAKAIGFVGLDYYFRAIEYLTGIVSEPEFFVFSDDIQWAQANLRLSHPLHFVTHNGAEKDYEDLQLMSHCKHHIIANSSFSWWGAWLSDNPAKVVIAPRRWFRQFEVDIESRFPADWIVL